MPIKEDTVVPKIKEWLTPILITITGLMVWTQLTELKTDVRALLIQRAMLDVRVYNLEKEVDNIRLIIRENHGIAERSDAKKEDGPEVPSGD